MAKHLLKDIALRSAKPDTKDYRLSDGDGLYLLVKTLGAKWWRFDYSFEGKRKTLSLGVYPQVSLADARIKTQEARSQVSQGINPSDARKQLKVNQKQSQENTHRLAQGLPVVNSFADVTQRWLAFNQHRIAKITHTKKIARLTQWAFPVLGPLLIDQIKSKDIAHVLRPLTDKNQLETAHRLRSEMSAIYDFAIVQDLCEYNPVQAVAKQIPPQKVKHRAAIIDPSQLGQLLRDIDRYQGTLVVQCALRYSPLVFQRPGEIRQMQWADVDWSDCMWRLHISKTDIDHLVPLSTQALAILNELKPLTGSGQYVFPSQRGKGRPMSENTIRTALQNMGYDSDQMTAHGFRSTASTLLNEQGWHPDAIERQLAHVPSDPVRAAYNRALHLDERRQMMQSWADYLDSLKASAS
jgi:integrase